MDERIKFLRKAVNFAFDGLVETSLKIGDKVVSVNVYESLDKNKIIVSQYGDNGEGEYRKLKEFSTASKSEAKRMVNEFAKEEK